MKYYLFVTVFLFGSFFIFQKSVAGNNDIVISEIGAYATSTHEWIEIWNKGNEPIDIKDWKFWENNTNHGIKAVSSSDSIISPNEYAIICQDADVFMMDYPGFANSIFDSSWLNLSENGEEIGLKDGNNNFIEQFSFVSTTKFSLERKDLFLNDYSSENWQENQSGNTVGLKNSNYFFNEVVTTTNTSTNFSTSTEAVVDISTSSSEIINWEWIKLNEIVSDPLDGNEMVELYNNGSSTMNLNGGNICDSTAENCKVISGAISAHDWLVIDMLTNRYFNNSGDSVVLKDTSNNVVDQVVFGTPTLPVAERNQSLIRVQDGVDTDENSDWAVSNKITLGFANVLAVSVVENKSAGNNNSVLQNNSNTTVPPVSKITKSPTTTKVITEPKDSVNISWKLDWPYALDIGESGVFSAQESADPRGGDVSVLWNFGDMSSSTGALVSHSFVTSGVYLVSVVASSSAGTIDKKQFKVNVGNNFSIAHSNVKISDYQVTSTDYVLEYIVIKNNLDNPQNVSGWKLKNKSGKEYEIPEKTIIQPSSTLKFFRSVHHLSFDKNGDEIRLMSPNDKELDVVKINSEKNVKKEIKPVGIKRTSNWISTKGVVTVLPKTFGLQYFYISSGQKGYQIYQYKKDFPEIKIGDEILVGGEVSVTDGVERIKIKNKNAIKILSSNQEITPIDLQLEDVSKDLLGLLVKISGDITEIKSNLMYVDDGVTEISVYFKKGSKINKQEVKEGDKVEIVGILSQNKSGWQVLPRSMSDIVIVESTTERLGALSQGKQNEVAKTYLTTTAGGLTALLLSFLIKLRGPILLAGSKKIANLVIGAIKRG